MLNVVKTVLWFFVLSMHDDADPYEAIDQVLKNEYYKYEEKVQILRSFGGLTSVELGQ